MATPGSTPTPGPASSPSRTRLVTFLAYAIARQEGFQDPSSPPRKRNNPGNLRHSPHSSHPGGAGHEDDIGTIDTVEHGWDDLERQILIVVEAHSEITVEEFFAGQRDESGEVIPWGYPGWCPVGDKSAEVGAENRPEEYARHVVDWARAIVWIEDDVRSRAVVLASRFVYVNEASGTLA